MICVTCDGVFQSSPGFGAGRYACLLLIVAGCLGFNPRPALGPGATILPGRRRLALRLFQSSPGFGAGRYCGILVAGLPVFRFNPRPALGPGATTNC